MLVGIVWNGLGLCCLFFILKMIKILRKKLRKERAKDIFTTVAIGVISGIAGVALGVFTFYCLDIIIYFDPATDMIFAIRILAVSIVLVFGAYFVGILAEKFLHRVCRKEATVNISVIVSLLVVSQPIVYGWLTRIWTVMTG